MRVSTIRAAASIGAVLLALGLAMGPAGAVTPAGSPVGFKVIAAAPYDYLTPISGSATWFLYSDLNPRVGVGLTARAKYGAKVAVPDEAAFSVLGGMLIGPNYTGPDGETGSTIIGLTLPSLTEVTDTLPAGATYVGPAPDGYVYANAEHAVYRKWFSGKQVFLATLTYQVSNDSYASALSGPAGVVEFGDLQPVQYVSYAHPGAFVQLSFPGQNTSCPSLSETLAACFSASTDGTHRTDGRVPLDGSPSQTYTDALQVGDPSCVNETVAIDGNAIAWVGSGFTCRSTFYVLSASGATTKASAEPYYFTVSAYGHVVVANGDQTKLLEITTP